MNDPAWTVRSSAAYALSRQKADPIRVVPALTMSLKDSNESVVIVALRALREFGDQAKSALPTLLSRRQDFPARAKSELAETIRAIDPALAAQVFAGSSKPAT